MEHSNASVLFDYLSWYRTQQNPSLVLFCSVLSFQSYLVRQDVGKQQLLAHCLRQSILVRPASRSSDLVLLLGVIAASRGVEDDPLEFLAILCNLFWSLFTRFFSSIFLVVVSFCCFCLSLRAFDLFVVVFFLRTQTGLAVAKNEKIVNFVSPYHELLILKTYWGLHYPSVFPFFPGISLSTVCSYAVLLPTLPHLAQQQGRDNDVVVVSLFLEMLHRFSFFSPYILSEFQLEFSAFSWK